MFAKLVRRLALKLAPLTVCADWEDGVTLHKSWTRKDALEWIACYPADAVVLVRNRRNAVIAWRA
jgi:hypothetical protein